MRLWTCPELWPDSTVFIVGGGPSLIGFQFERLRGQRVIAINNAIYSVPFADYLFFGDRRWWAHHRNWITKPKSEIVTNSPSVGDSDMRNMRRINPPPGLVDDRESLPMTWTSAQAAMQLGVHLGAKHLVLLGIDARPSSDGKHHHHEEHIWPPVKGVYEKQIENLALMVRPLEMRGIAVTNCSPVSAIPFWPKRPIEDVLCPAPT